MAEEKETIEKIKSIILKKEPNAKIILYGSRARGTSKPGSDWDILVLLNKENVTKQMEQELRHYLFDLELEIGEPVSVFVYSKKDWENKFFVTPYYRNIQREGVVLT